MDWGTLLGQMAFPAVCLIAIGVAAWRVLVWMGREVVIPVRDAHLEHLATQSEQLKLQTQALQQLVTTVEIMSERQEQHIRICSGPNPHAPPLPG